MKTVLDKLSDKQAQKEVEQRTYWLFASSIITFFILWPLAFAVAILGPRNFILTYHKGNRKRKDLLKIRVFTGIAVALSVITLVINFASS